MIGVNPNIAAALNNIGILHNKLSSIDSENKQKHLEYELEYTQKAVEINQKLYGDSPSYDLARSMQDLSAIYARKGGVSNMKQAYQLQKQALEMYQELYAADHPKVIKALNNLNYITDNIDSESYSDYDNITDEAPQLVNTQVNDNEQLAVQDSDADKDPVPLMGDMNNA